MPIIQKLRLDDGSGYEFHIPWPCKLRVVRRQKPEQPQPQFVKVHVAEGTGKIWKKKGTDIGYKVKVFDTTTTVADMMKKLLSARGISDFEAWAVTEIFKMDNDSWSKGSSIAFGADGAKEALASFDWTSERGVSQRPVWLCFHSVKSRL